MAAQVKPRLGTHRATEQWRPSTHLCGSLDDARQVLTQAGSVVVLTGAGVSTNSGVPDYRGPGALRATPMLYSEFVNDPIARQRYWARNFQGWAQVSSKSPNPAHVALASMEHDGWPTAMIGSITQNVDGLHEAAGSRRLVTLHGRGADVICLDCASRSTRASLQTRLAALNPNTPQRTDLPSAELRPDSDAVVEDWQGFQVADCEACGGMLKPDVVFFGEAVPKHRVVAATAWCDIAESMLVAGSSLTVMSGLRFVRQMARRGKPIVIINHGATRADELATVRLDGDVAQLLAQLVNN